MKFTFFLLVLMFPIPGFSYIDDWDRFNSSLLIEVKRPGGVFTCTGVAVSSQIIVTAAHCLEGKISSVKVFTQSNYDPKQPSLEVESYKIHPDYDPIKSKHKNDLGKIILKNKLPSIIRIYPFFHGTLIVGNIYRFGFGARNKKNIRTVITPSFRKFNLPDRIIELNDEHSISGDSGGPIFLQNGKNIYILAVHSTFSHGPLGNFSLNPLLSEYNLWILGP